MRGWLAAVSLVTLPLTAFATTNNALSLNRSITVNAHTGADAKCSLVDSLTGSRRSTTASASGQAV
ncbi:MAG TPA: hypothetical protein VGU02_00645, partial [Gaiellaceae bacterium]|nr:hypothetical protein [Gaiellaceae bacterium]